MVQRVLRKSTYDYYVVCDGGKDKRGCYGSYHIYRDDKIVVEESQYNYPALSTNNEAEYMALIRALERLLQVKGSHTNILVISDSELMVNQLLGYFAVRADHLILLHGTAKELLNRSDSWYLIHVPRKVIERILGH